MAPNEVGARSVKEIVGALAPSEPDFRAHDRCVDIPIEKNKGRDFTLALHNLHIALRRNSGTDLRKLAKLLRLAVSATKAYSQPRFFNSADTKLATTEYPKGVA